MGRRRIQNGRDAESRSAVSGLFDAVLEGDAVTTTAARREAFEGSPGEANLARHVDTVRLHAYRVTDAGIAGLRAEGLNDDMIFELTVAASLGAAVKCLAVLNLIDEGRS